MGTRWALWTPSAEAYSATQARWRRPHGFHAICVCLRQGTSNFVPSGMAARPELILASGIVASCSLRMRPTPAFVKRTGARRPLPVDWSWSKYRWVLATAVSCPATLLRLFHLVLARRRVPTVCRSRHVRFRASGRHFSGTSNL